MSGRIRCLKPELLDDERICSLSHGAFRMFVAIILMADDYGNLRAEPRHLFGRVLVTMPGESARSAQEYRNELQHIGLISLYSVRNQTYAHINGWSKHQRVVRPGKPRVPGPGDVDAKSVVGNCPTDLLSVPCMAAPPTSDVAIQDSVVNLHATFVSSHESRMKDSTPVHAADTPEEKSGAPEYTTGATDLRSPISDQDPVARARVAGFMPENETAEPDDFDGEPPPPRRSPAATMVPPAPPSGAQAPPGQPFGSGPTHRGLPTSEARLHGALWRESYERAVEQQTGGPWTFPPKSLPTLERVISKHCVGADRQDIDAWLRRTVAEFMRSVAGDPPTVWSSYSPDGLERWLNGGRKSGRAGPGRPEPEPPPYYQPVEAYVPGRDR